MQQHPHHAQQGPPPHHLQHPRPSSTVQQTQQHHPQQPSPAPSQHSTGYQSSHALPQYVASAQSSSSQHPQDLPYYTHQSPYSTPSAQYSSAETPEIMAAAQMTRPTYPPISYHTPQSNSPASVASPSGHDQHGRAMYGQPGPQMQQQQMYYQPQQQYSSMPPQNGPSPYGQHPPQHHQPMTSQPNLQLMSHAPGQHQMQHPAAQQQQQHQQPNMTSSPRPKIEHGVPQLQRPPTGPLGPPQHAQNAPPMNANNVPGAGVNPNAAPGPIPATTPLVVRQDSNGVQWIAFEYSRDRVKMEYTIRCDVESVNVDNLTPEFKTENCVYPRACCNKEQYRGNRLVYETECNTVGWALADLNPPLRGKRGLIQRAVDSWRNSNQDPRLRSRRVRRMAKINNRKAVQATHPTHMAGPVGPPGMPPSGGGMGPGAGAAANMGKPTLGNMPGPQLHHHAHPEGNAPASGDDVGDYGNSSSTHHHHHQTNGQPEQQQQQQQQQDVRHNQVFPGYQNYPPNPNVGGASMAPNMHESMGPMSQNHSIVARSKSEEDDRTSLFGDIPEAKKRKFILVEDHMKGTRIRVRVTLDTVDINEIPDSYRKANSVYPRSFFPLQMQDPPPSAHGEGYFNDDEPDEVDGGPRSRRGRTMVTVPVPDGSETEVATPKLRKSQRSKEIKLNELGYRMSWHQSRVFSGRGVFLQQALDQYRAKNKVTMDGMGQDVPTVAPHFETRPGKRRWQERTKKEKRDSDQ